MPKGDRSKMIFELGRRLGSPVICLLTSDRPNTAMVISRDCPKIMQQHFDLGETHKTLCLYIVSHGGDVDVPWEIVSLLRGQCGRLRALVPYVCHSAATLVALGCDELIVGPRGQLSPTDPSLTVRTGAGEDAPTLSFGVEDISAFVQFVRGTLGRGFSAHAHEALGKLIDRVQPELLGSINRTYHRNRLLIRKMLKMGKRKWSAAALNRITSHLSVAYYSHRHFISRREMIEDLGLPIVPAEEAGCSDLAWELYEDYASEFQSRRPLDLQAEFQRAGKSPFTLELKGKYIESGKRTDVYVETVVASGTGMPDLQFRTPEVEGVPPDAVQRVFGHFAGQLQQQLKPFLVAKKISSFGEWRSE